MSTIYKNDFTNTWKRGTFFDMTQAATQISERAPTDLRLAPAVRPDVVPTALLVECTCPDWCERDHDRD